jgi:hypothetical protein
MATYIRQQEIAHAIGPEGRLEIRLVDGDVRLRPSDGDEARLRVMYEISATSEDKADQAFEITRLDVVRGGGVLEVRARPDADRMGSAIRRLLSGEGGVQVSIEGEAPAGCQLRLETVSGDVVVDGMRGEQRYRTVSGDLVATDLDGSVRLTTVSGDATIRGPRALRLSCETVSGDLSIMAPVISDARLSSVSGDLELEGALALEGTFRAETVSGDLAVGLLGGGSFEVRGISTDVHAEMDHRLEGRQDRRRVVIGEGRPTFVFSSMSGDILIRRPRRLEGAVPAPPAPPAPPAAAAPPANRAAAEADALDVLRALERGEIDVEEAGRRLAGGTRDA